MGTEGPGTQGPGPGARPRDPRARLRDPRARPRAQAQAQKGRQGAGPVPRSNANQWHASNANQWHARAADGQFIKENTGFSIAGPGQIDQPKENDSKIEVWEPRNSADR